MLGLSVGITLFATLLTAWGAAGERPLSALRYE
jgi:ABC-type lipoprotein release transport system permease subunit